MSGCRCGFGELRSVLYLQDRSMYIILIVSHRKNTLLHSIYITTSLYTCLRVQIEKLSITKWGRRRYWADWAGQSCISMRVPASRREITASLTKVCYHLYHSFITSLSILATDEAARVITSSPPWLYWEWRTWKGAWLELERCKQEELTKCGFSC